MNFTDKPFQLIQGDCLERLKDIPSDTIQTCITSPPYFGLRDYGADGQIGLEKTLGEYVQKLTAVFSEVRRILKNDGTLWLNLGDSYAGGGGGNYGSGLNVSVHKNNPMHLQKAKNLGFKSKDLMMIPARVAIALQENGWYLRSEIIWHKPNPMPESVTDRPTKSHEQIYLLAKSSTYFYDYEAIKEKQTESSIDRRRYGWFGGTDDNSNGARSGSSFKRMVQTGEPMATIPADGMRNKRSVWTVTLKGYSEAHFATFPEKLIEPCVLAGSQIGDTVLDPFNGAGTTGLVALKNGRNYIGIELNPDYLELTKKRLSVIQTKLF